MGEAKLRKVSPSEIGEKVARLNPKHGEDALVEIEALKIRLDNGKVVTFVVADELRVPSNPVKLLEAARKSPARVAFWRAQAARAMRRFREEERKYDYTFAAYDLTHRAANNDADGEYTERLVKSQVLVTREVLQARKKLERAEEQANLLRAVADAVEHRAYTIRRMIAERNEG